MKRKLNKEEYKDLAKLIKYEFIFNYAEQFGIINAIKFFVFKPRLQAAMSIRFFYLWFGIDDLDKLFKDYLEEIK